MITVLDLRSNTYMMLVITSDGKAYFLPLRVAIKCHDTQVEIQQFQENFPSISKRKFMYPHKHPINTIIAH